MEENNSFKKLEPVAEVPRAELKKVVMQRIGLKEVLVDLLGLFTVNLGRSAWDILDNKDHNNREDEENESSE